MRVRASPRSNTLSLSDSTAEGWPKAAGEIAISADLASDLPMAWDLPMISAGICGTTVLVGVAAAIVNGLAAVLVGRLRQ